MLEVDYSEELGQLSGTIIGEIISRMLKEKQKVTGKTIDSITDEVRPTGITIWAAPYIMALDTGRGPTRSNVAGEPKLVDIILTWIKDKGIIPKEGTTEANYETLAFLITRRIHNEGNIIHRTGAHTGIITLVLTEKRIDTFIGTFSRKFMDFVRSEILLSIEKN